MYPSADVDTPKDLQSMSFNSTTTTTTTADIHRSTSSGSDWTAPSGDSLRRSASFSFSDLRFLRRIGAGDIGAVYLAELKPPPPASSAEHRPKPPSLLAAKVMDRKELARRNKEGRARTEREILQMLDHPFLPTLYAAVDSPDWHCLLTEFCPGGDLHVLRQRQTFKRFPDSAVRFYASEVVVALEYLHMMGIVYRDLKPENVLVRSDGHIMLTDFDLSMMCDDTTSTPARVISNAPPPPPYDYDYALLKPLPLGRPTSCILPNCIVPSVSCSYLIKRKKHKKDLRPAFVAEPIDIRSMSFVGTHEYLAPEIITGEGHGNAVDWWTLGIFIFELFYGVTPFRGADHEVTLANIVARALEFPKEPVIPGAAKDLISQCLVKDPSRRMGSTMGASHIKRHPFFQGVNWALLRCTTPPFVPPPFVSHQTCLDSTPMEYF